MMNEKGEVKGMKESEEIRISVRDVDISELGNLSEQSAMLFLKEAGAPIEGTVFLSVKDGWSVRRITDPVKGRTFIFTRKATP
jgi:hypothetical protein